jgi:uncharacterized protein
VEAEFETQFVTAGSLLYAVEHRPWPPPDSQWLFSQSANKMLLAHFAVDPPALRRLVPEALTLELYDGVAWLTISPQYTSYLRPSGVPPLPGLSFFPQVSVRTYVTAEERPGTYYFSVDAASRSAVWCARVLLRMPCWPAKIEMAHGAFGPDEEFNSLGGPAIRFRSRRLRGPAASGGTARFDVAYAAEGHAARARPGSLDEFLTERYCVYLWNGRRLYRSEIHHQPWPLQRAIVELRENNLAEPLGLALPAQPDLCHFADCNKMLAWAPQRVLVPR